jgi:hypothetical protein
MMENNGNYEDIYPYNIETMNFSVLYKERWNII